EYFSAGNPDPVVARRHVDDVRRVDIDVHVGGGVRGLDGGGVATGYHGGFPALRVAEEELDRVRADGDRLGERVSNVDVGSDARHAPSLLLAARALPDEA